VQDLKITVKATWQTG